MTESDWLTCTDPQWMLYVIQGPSPEHGGFPTRKISDRKLRLFKEALATQPSDRGRAALLRDIAGNPWRQNWYGEGWWLTPIIALARAAYDERPGRVCGECAGSGLNVHVASSADRCPDCHGTGKIEDGSLDPQRLAVLSDAIEEAGCDNEEILRHLRSSGPHVRGCWCLDCILGKS